MKSTRNHRGTFRTILASLLLVSLCMAETPENNSTTGKASGLRRTDKNTIIYVTDFTLVGNFKQDKGGVTGKGYLLPAPPTGLRRKQQDASIEVANLTELMTESLLAELNQAGFTARYLSPADPRPSEGLVLRGVFTQLDEGNQMRRSLIGFGSGKAKVEVYVTITDAGSAAQHLDQTFAQKSSSKAPGAVIAFNPYVGAVNFVAKVAINKHSPEKIVKKTASKIAEEVSKQLNTGSEVAAKQSEASEEGGSL